MVLVKILVLLAAVFVGVLIIVSREKIVRTIGKMSWAEAYLGPGGTYTMWVFIGLGLILIALIWLVGTPWG